MFQHSCTYEAPMLFNLTDSVKTFKSYVFARKKQLTVSRSQRSQTSNVRRCAGELTAAAQQRFHDRDSC